MRRVLLESVALEHIQAPSCEDSLARENEIIREASKWSTELAAACEWKEIKFVLKAMDTFVIQ
ncbi:hypothetical protein Nepgr_033986 [Nepenthes gracilis]|uniref:Uncharacterized protein n=1 Tax=Nepenthes gracilis TaxID=150966 RepID=A0AAD3Y727_NEPGR|nr:hypothetical protein Nepgr_033986 [Nepenthes gracilis]